MTDTEHDNIQHIQFLLGQISMQCRMGMITLAQVDERINHISWLLDHPGWQVNRPINFEEATHDRL